ncbi:shikimate kinase [Archaeoglobus profundus]|uniref:Shikimate kinase n=1 Tax=Archaeoglobus profundus (strain DSM 5631 / JCM 9629 / NBRC 100127 / Av18) TaxID=572546 RepID=D2RFN5_ARCPA|nr:shikimate kinase [Archaeoglobus profundus]ADB57110.1 shikimate kinase [Archaeoglobus profundus DSM 5631]
MKAQAYSAGTIINALATGYGCAFGLDLKLKVRVDFEVNDNVVVENGIERRSIVLDTVLNHFGLNAVVEVESEIPKGSGLGSSSAFLNALLLAVYKYISKSLNAGDILRLNAKLSLECGISYTGAFDDASASLLGGIVLTDNTSMQMLRWEFKRAKAVILIPEFGRGRIDLNEIRRDLTLVRKALKFARRGDYKSAMYYNTLHYCKAIGYPIEVVEIVKDSNCCCGLSGNGPCFVAFGDVKEVKKVWEAYGNVIETKIVNEPCDDIVITHDLFSYSELQSRQSDE